MRVFVSSSWRNERQPAVVSALHDAGHEVYDFRHPDTDVAGFTWADIDAGWRDWTPKQFRDSLADQRVQRA
ncbi:MAG TPA: hypothetical protein VFY10_02895, partial [Dehalococcoidia bacterium]|nr:hypothetical protein [Dehalococcoidia bacterium]